MLTVTSVTREGRKYIIDCGGELTVRLDSDSYSQVSIEPGDEVDEELLRQLAARSMYRCARDRALYAIGRREHCRGGLIDLLCRTGNCERDIAAQVADEMEELGFLNDRRYASMLAEYLYRDKHFGRRRVVMEMTRKGLDRDTAALAAEEHEPDPAEALDTLLEGSFGRDLHTPAGIRRAMNNLLRYGYTPGDIRAAISRRTAADCGDTDTDGFGDFD